MNGILGKYGPILSIKANNGERYTGYREILFDPADNIYWYYDTSISLTTGRKENTGAGTIGDEKAFKEYIKRAKLVKIEDK